MKELNGITGVLYAFSEWVLRLSAINIPWFVLSLPLFAALMMPDISTAAGLVLFGLGVLLFVPLLFFPATAAVFAAVRDWIVDNPQPSTVRAYFSHLRTDYMNSLQAGGIFSIVWLAWYFGFLATGTSGTLPGLLFLAAGAALSVYTIIFLAVSAHYRMNLKGRLKTAFLISAGSPLLGLFVIAASGLIIWVSVTRLLVLLPLFVCSLSAFLSFAAFYRFAQKMGRKAEDEHKRGGGNAV